MLNLNNLPLSRIEGNPTAPLAIYLTEGPNFLSKRRGSNQVAEIELYSSIEAAISEGIIVLPTVENELFVGQTLFEIDGDENEGKYIYHLISPTEEIYNGVVTTSGEESAIMRYYNQSFDSSVEVQPSGRVSLSGDNGTDFIVFELSPQNNGILVSGSNFEGIKYSSNISSNYIDRSLVDKAYVDSVALIQGVTDYEDNLQDGFQSTHFRNLDGTIEGAIAIITESGEGSNIWISNYDSSNGSFSHARFSTGELSLVSTDSLSNTTSVNLGTNINLNSPNPISVTGSTIDYNIDYSSSYTDRSLVDKNYVDYRTYDTTVFVKQASDFGTIDSTKIYVVDGIIDMGTISIEIPVGGINIKGLDFNVSQLVSSEDNYTMFTSPVGGSGSLNVSGVAFETSGTNSQVFNVVGNTGFEAIEFTSTNFNNCTSLGTIDTYRQGLEINTGRFGGTPSLTLAGTWIGGYFIDTSIVRGITDGSYALYQAGTGFSMGSRFRSNQNLDLNNTVAFIDFSPSNFVNPSTLQLDGCIVTRGSIIDASDTTIHPNISPMDLASAWKQNVGVGNTFVGGNLTISTEVETTINTTGVFEDLAGTWTTAGLEHFDSPTQGQLRHLGNSPREFRIYINAAIDGGANDEIDLKVVVWDNSASTFIDYKTQRRVINNFQGGRDVAFFTFQDNIFLDQNDYVKLQVANSSDTTNVTAELNSEFTVEPR